GDRRRNNRATYAQGRHHGTRTRLQVAVECPMRKLESGYNAFDVADIWNTKCGLLAGVAQIDPTLEGCLLRLKVLAGQPAGALGLQRDESLFRLVEGFFGERVDKTLNRVTADIGVEHAEGAEHAGQARYQHPATAKAARNRCSVNGRSTADRQDA